MKKRRIFRVNLKMNQVYFVHKKFNANLYYRQVKRKTMKNIHTI